MKQLILFAAALLFIVACNNAPEHKTGQITNEQVAEETLRFNMALDSIFDEDVALSPVRQAYLGIKDNYGEWTPNNDSIDLFNHERAKEHVAFIQASFDTEMLDPQAQLTHRMIVNDYKKRIENFKWRYHNYPINQMFGTHTWIPSFLMNIHDISEHQDALDYLSRLSKVDNSIDELIAKLEIRRKKGIMAPKFVYPYVITSATNLIQGAPLSNKGINPLYEDYKNDVQALLEADKINQEEADALVDRASVLLKEVFKPAYLKLIDYVNEIEKEADDKAGVWKLPDGAEYYKVALERTTTTELTPQFIFDKGMAEIERIHAEMETIKEQVGFEGTLEAFFTFMSEDKQFYYPNTDEGRDAYLTKNIEIIDAMREKLDELFITKPKAELVVKRVEPFREKSAGIAFYQGPAIDGSRPGTYYANLYDMNQMPKYEIEALSYHEAIPGHHMQISIAQELENLPKYRTIGTGYTSYSEGWGLYSEFIPKEMGFYQDPYSDFGRLSMELWRACRLVVDVGIHDKQWTREEGIAFYVDNTPAAEGDCVKMVERHIVMPSQATAYKIGQMKILELREKAKDILGDKFDIREFHEVVLTNGPVPLNILEELVSEWVNSKM